MYNKLKISIKSLKRGKDKREKKEIEKDTKKDKKRERKRIMIIDSDDQTSSLVRMYLSHRRYEVFAAVDPQEALQQLDDETHENFPHLVLVVCVLFLCFFFYPVSPIIYSINNLSSISW